MFLAFETETLTSLGTQDSWSLDTSICSHSCPGEWPCAFAATQTLSKKQKLEGIDSEVIESLRKLEQYFLAFIPHAILKTWNKYNQIIFSG